MRRPITLSLYQLLTDAFRESPGNSTFAMAKAACGRDLAKRAWERGWTEQHTWARPIRDVLNEEKDLVRVEQRRRDAEARTASQQERDKVREDAVQVLAQEGQMIKLGRASVLGTLASVSQMVPAIKKIAESMRDRIMGGENIPPKEGMRVLRDYTNILRTLTQCGQTLVEAERQSKGEPMKIVGFDLDSGATMTVEEAMREMEELSSLYELAKRQGLVSNTPINRDSDPDTTH